MLRKAGETTSDKSLRVTLKDLFSEMVPDRRTSANITVRRGTAIGKLQRADRRIDETHARPRPERDRRALTTLSGKLHTGWGRLR